MPSNQAASLARSGAATTLRRKLLVLAAVTIVPLLLFDAAVVVSSFYTYREAARQGLQSTAQALSLAVDEQIITWKTALTVLSISPALDNGDYAAFRQQAEFITQRYGGWLALSLPSGQQVVNTSRPVGSDLPHSAAAALPPEVVRDGKAHVSGLFREADAQDQIIAVTIPAVRNGTVTHALHLGISPQDMARLLARQGLPESWFAGVIDRDNRIVTRVPYDPRFLGTLGSDSYIRAVAGGAENGSFEGSALSDTQVYGSFESLTQAPWTLVLAAPKSELAHAWQRPLMVLAGGGAVFAMVAAALALVMGHRIASPINALAGAARAAVEGQFLPQVPDSRVREISELRNAVMTLSEKQVLLREANHRIKNSLQIVSSSLGLQGRTAPREETKASFRRAQAHIQAIARLHERLYQTGLYDDVAPFDLVRSICADIATFSTNRAVVEVETAGAAILDSARAAPFALIVAELATNAVKHASQPGKAGHVKVRCSVADESMIVVTIADSGPGLPPDFDLAGQPGLGLRMCLALTEQIGGTLRVVPASGGAVLELRVHAAAT